jgi:hypothetical protein
VKCRARIAPAGHAAAQVPQALQSAPITRLRRAPVSNAIAP